MTEIEPATRLNFTRKGTGKEERLLVTPLTSRLLQRPELGALAGTVLIFAFFAAVAGDSGMFSARGIFNFLEVSAQLGILAVAVSLLMIGGEFDLSVGSMIAFAGILMGLFVTVYGLPLWLAVLITFAIAALAGLLNGSLIIRTRLPSFIVTLASMYLLRGAALVASRDLTGRTQIPNITAGSEDSLIVQLFSGKIGYGLFEWLGHQGII